LPFLAGTAAGLLSLRWRRVVLVTAAGAVTGPRGAPLHYAQEEEREGNRALVHHAHPDAA
jgi:hypothetical protein